MKKIHTWTESEEAQLEQAVQDLESYRRTCEERDWPMARFWDAVTGRMAPEVLVSGKACYERWKQIQGRKPAQEMAADAWERVIGQVEEYEEDLQKATYDHAKWARDGVQNIIESMADAQTQAGTLAAVNRVKGVTDDTIQSVAVNYAAMLRVEAKLDRLLAELGVKP